MQKLRALKEFRYNGLQLKLNDPFDANDKDANLLKRIGRAEDAPIDEEPVRQKRAYRRRDLAAEEVSAVSTTDMKPE